MQTETQTELFMIISSRLSIVSALGSESQHLKEKEAGCPQERR